MFEWKAGSEPAPEASTIEKEADSFPEQPPVTEEAISDLSGSARSFLAGLIGENPRKIAGAFAFLSVLGASGEAKSFGFDDEAQFSPAAKAEKQERSERFEEFFSGKLSGTGEGFSVQVDKGRLTMVLPDGKQRKFSVPWDCEQVKIVVNGQEFACKSMGMLRDGGTFHFESAYSNPAGSSTRSINFVFPHNSGSMPFSKLPRDEKGAVVPFYSEYNVPMTDRGNGIPVPVVENAKLEMQTMFYKDAR